MSFTKRTTKPSSSDKNWIHTSGGGYNKCIKISGYSVLPNCTGYAWGRFREVLRSTPSLSTRNAELWYGNTGDGYKRGKTAKLGAVICFKDGPSGVGHVAVVEQINSNGSILISESHYGGNPAYFRTITLPKGYSYGSGLIFQGFIYNPAVKDGGDDTDGEYIDKPDDSPIKNVHEFMSTNGRYYYFNFYKNARVLDDMYTDTWIRKDSPRWRVVFTRYTQIYRDPALKIPDTAHAKAGWMVNSHNYNHEYYKGGK